MKWTHETITARLDEIEKTRREKKAKFNSELVASKAKLANLDTALSEAEDPDEYKRILREKNEAETYIEFLERRTKTARPGDDVNHEEYKDIQSWLLAEVETAQKDYAPKIEKALSSLLNVLEEYYTKVNASETVRESACKVFLGHGLNGHKTNEVIKKMNDPLLYADHMLRAFFTHRQMVDFCYRKVTNPNPFINRSMYSTADEAKICNELKRRLDKK